MSTKKRPANSDTNGKSKKQKQEGEESAGSDVEETEISEEQNNGENDTGFKLEPPMLSGELLICGATNWDLCGRKSLPKGMKNAGGPNLWGPNRMSSLKDVKIRTVSSGCASAHSFAISDEGKVYAFGRNEKGQLGLGSTDRQDIPHIVDALSSHNIISVACGRRHSLFLNDRGRVFSCGENKMGQLGLGNQSEQVLVPTMIRYKGPPIKRIACGGEFSAIIDISGNVHSFGCPEYGQLGHNSDGKYFVTSNKLEFQCETSPRVLTVFVEKHRDGQVTPITDVDAREIACGVNHAILVDSKKRVFSWGFGGYGRLGHAEPKDEMVPRMIKFFDGPNRGATLIAAGGTYSMAVSEHGALYFWGLNKPTGEATMYPKLVQDLSGWVVRSIGTSNKSIVVAADESVVSWGPSPTYGELGYGDEKLKSSTTPKEVRPLEGVYIQQVACGFSHSLMIARVDSQDDHKAVEKLPVFTP